MITEAEALAVLEQFDVELQRRTRWVWWLRISVGIYAVLLILQWFVFDPNPWWLTLATNLAGMAFFACVVGWTDARISTLEAGIAALSTGMKSMVR